MWMALLVSLLCRLKAQQRFFNLTADEVKVDSVLPHFLYSIPLPENYQDSVYTVLGEISRIYGYDRERCGQLQSHIRCSPAFAGAS